MDFKIAVLAGDGIGPEISVQGVDVMTAVCEKFGHKVDYKYALCGAHAIDEVGDPFPEETYQICKDADQTCDMNKLTRISSHTLTLNLIMILQQRFVRSKVCWLCVKNWDFLPIFVRYRLSSVWYTNLR